MKRTIQVLLCLSVAMPFVAHAQIIMCKDASGKTHTADRPLMECADRPIREFGSAGYLKREVPAPLTAEQKRQKQIEEEKRQAEEAALAEQKHADRAMLARYRNEADIEVARQRTLDIIREQVKRQISVLAAAEKQQKEVQSEVAQFKNTKDVPLTLQHRVQEADKAVHSQTKKVRDYEAEMAQVNGRYDATLKRFRELNQTSASR
jgi:hypothetical protein